MFIKSVELSNDSVLLVEGVVLNYVLKALRRLVRYLF